MCRTVGVTSTSSRWVNVGSGSRAELLTGERVTALATFLQWKFHRSCRATDFHGGAAAAAHTASTFSTLMSVEADTGLCHVTKLMNTTARARGHTIFVWSTTVNILHRFQDRPITQQLKITQILCSSIWTLSGVTAVRIS